jgi:hypothetical protein
MIRKMLIVLSAFQFAVAGCAVSAWLNPGRADNPANIEVISTGLCYSPGYAQLTVCWDPPGPYYALGRVPGDVTLSDGSISADLKYYNFIELIPREEGGPDRACGRLTFPLPEGFQCGECTLTIKRLAGITAEDPDWAEIQRALDEANTGIVIEPSVGGDSRDFTLISWPENMTDLEAHYIVVGMLEPVVIGPWVFPVVFGE